MTDLADYRYFPLGSGVYMHTAVVPMMLNAREYGIISLLTKDGVVRASNKWSPGSNGIHTFTVQCMSTDAELEVRVFRGTVEPWYPFARPIDFIRDEIKRRLSWLYRRDDWDDEEEWEEWDD